MEIVKKSCSGTLHPQISSGHEPGISSAIPGPQQHTTFPVDTGKPKGIVLFDPKAEKRFLTGNASAAGVFTGSCYNILELIDCLYTFNPAFILINERGENEYILSAIRLVNTQFPQIRILILLDDHTFGFAREFLRNGAFGFISRHQSNAMIFQQLGQIEGGCFPVPQAIYEDLVAQLRPQPEKAYMQHYHLTLRQQEIMQHMLAGCSYKIIAARLNIRYHTVHNHIKSIYVKLGVNSMSEAITKVLRQT